MIPFIETSNSLPSDHLRLGAVSTPAVGALPRQHLILMTGGHDWPAHCRGALKESRPCSSINFRRRIFQQRLISAGAVLGAPVRPWLTDRSSASNCSSSRWRVILTANPARDGACLGCSERPPLFRFLTGAGIGGEYTAINSPFRIGAPPRIADGLICDQRQFFLDRVRRWCGQQRSFCRSGGDRPRSSAGGWRTVTGALSRPWWCCDASGFVRKSAVLMISRGYPDRASINFVPGGRGRM